MALAPSPQDPNKLSTYERILVGPTPKKKKPLADILLEAAAPGPFDNIPMLTPDDEPIFDALGRSVQPSIGAFNIIAETLGDAQMEESLRQRYIQRTILDSTMDGVIDSLGRRDYSTFRLAMPNVDVDTFNKDFVRRWGVLRGVRNLDWPGKYGALAREEFDKIPSLMKFDMIRSDLPDEEMAGLVTGIIGMKVKEAVESSFFESQKLSIPENVIDKWSNFNIGFLSAGTQPARGLIGSVISTAFFGDKAETRAADMALMDAFSNKGLMRAGIDASAVESISKDPYTWASSKMLDNALVNGLMWVADRPARAMDYAAREVASAVNDIMGPQPHLRGGQVYTGVETYGQLVAYPLKDSPIAFNLLSGTADAIKMFSADSFVAFGKVIGYQKGFRGLTAIGADTKHYRVKDVIKQVNRGIKSRPVQRFIEDYVRTPHALREPGAMSRKAQMYGWDVDIDVWTRLWSEPKITKEGVEVILREEALGMSEDIIGGPGRRVSFKPTLASSMWQNGEYVGSTTTADPRIRTLPFYSWHRPLRDTIENSIRYGRRMGRTQIGKLYDNHVPHELAKAHGVEAEHTAYTSKLSKSYPPDVLQDMHNYPTVVARDERIRELDRFKEITEGNTRALEARLIEAEEAVAKLEVDSDAWFDARYHWDQISRDLDDNERFIENILIERDRLLTKWEPIEGSLGYGKLFEDLVAVIDPKVNPRHYAATQKAMEDAGVPKRVIVYRRQKAAELQTGASGYMNGTTDPHVLDMFPGEHIHTISVDRKNIIGFGYGNSEKFSNESEVIFLHDPENVGRLVQKRLDNNVSRWLRTQFRMTHGSWLPPKNKPLADNLIRRMGDFLFGSTAQDDVAAGLVDDYITRWSVSPSDAERYNVLGEMLEDGFRSYMKRAADDLGIFLRDEELTQMLDRLSELYPKGLTGKRQIFNGVEGLKPTTRPTKAIYASELNDYYPVPSYEEFLSFRRELVSLLTERLPKGANRQKLKNIVADVDAAIGAHLMNPIKTLWVVRPGLPLKAGGEELLHLFGDVEAGAEARRIWGQRVLRAVSSLPFKEKRIAWRKEKIRIGAKLPPPLRLSRGSGLSWNQYIEPKMEQAFDHIIDEVGQLDPHKIQAYTPDHPGFIPAWHYQINENLINDPLSSLIISRLASGTTMEVVEEVAMKWLLQSDNGMRYLTDLTGKKFPNDVSYSAKTAKELGEIGKDLADSTVDIIRVRMDDLYNLIGGDTAAAENILTHINAAALSGKGVDLDILRSWHANGFHPTEVIGPAAVNMGSVDQMARQGFFARKAPDGGWTSFLHKLTKMPLSEIISKGLSGAWNVSANITDRYVRSVGFDSYKSIEARRLSRIRDIQQRHGFAPLPQILIEDRSAKFAFEKMFRYENPIEHSRADYWLKNIVLFTYNQANFMKRWGRTLVHNPGYASRFRSFMDGMEDIGFVEKDESGNLVFQLPISTDFYKWLLTHEQSDRPSHFGRLAFSLGFNPLSQGAGIFHSGPFQAFGRIALPPGMPFSAQVEPGFSPLFTVPVAALTAARPDLDFLRDAVLGGFENWDTSAPGIQNLFASIGPGYIKSITRALSGDHGDRTLVNSFRDLLAWGELTGVADPFSDEAWETKTGFNFFSLARGLALFKGITQFAFPYSLASPVYMEEVDRYHQLVESTGSREKAVAQFLSEQNGKGWPIITALTEKSDVEVGSNVYASPRFLLAPTAHAEEFFREHKEFFDRYPDIAGIFTYRADDAYDQTSFRRQMLRGQRSGRDLETLKAELAIEAASHEYYDDINPRLKELEAEGRDVSDARRDAIKHLDGLYPGFEHYYNQFSERAYLRQVSVDNLIQAVNDPAVRDLKATKPLSIFLSQYVQVRDAVRAPNWANNPNATLAGRRDTTTVRAALVDLYNRLQVDFGHSVPLEKAYTYLFRFELEDG